MIKKDEAFTVLFHDLKSAGTTIRDASNSLSKKLKKLGVYEKVKYPIDDTYNTSEFLLMLLKQTDWIWSADLPTNPRLVNLEEIVTRIKAIFYNIASNYKLRLSFSDFDSLGKVYIDPDLVEQALFNLLMNAIKYAYRNTDIEIKASLNPGRGNLFYICT